LPGFFISAFFAFKYLKKPNKLMFMKKMLLLAAATVLATVSFSQVRFGAQVIGSAGSASIKSEQLSNFKTPMQVGFGAGIVTDISMQKNFGVRSSLNFLQKKSSVEFTSFGTDKKSTINSTLSYVELPVNFLYKVPMKGASVYFGAGPSFGYGISGKLKYQGFDASDGVIHAVDETTDAFKKEDKGGAGMKRFDISANVNAGLQFDNGLYINAGYLAGLSNLTEGDGKYKNKGILLTVGVLLP
jgi:hypothetical protein